MNNMDFLFNSRRNRKFGARGLALALGSLVCLANAVYCSAADFAGNLKGVTITDQSGTNAPPAAVFSYTKDGAAVNFDAAGSVDSDGKISEYRWDFGDGVSGSGVFVSHQFSSGSFPVTLTLVDDKGAIAVAQNVVLIPAIEDIGNKIELTESKYIDNTQIFAYKLPLLTGAKGGQLKSISLTAQGVGHPRRFKLALYTHDVVKNRPELLVPGSVTVEGVVSGTSPELMTLNLASGSPQISANTQYWVGFQALDKYFTYYRKYDSKELVVYKNVSAYNWMDWNGSADGVLTYQVGKCFFTYEAL